MLLKLLLVLCVTLTSADDCWLGDWTPWSECEPRRGCNVPQDYNPESWKMEVEVFDSGRLVMERMVAAKKRRAEEIRTCREDGTCPQFAIPDSFGSVKCENNFAGPYPCHNADLLSFLNFEDMAGPFFSIEAGGNDIWGWTDPENGDEYALMGMTSGTGFILVNDPTRPRPIAFIPSHNFLTSLWRDIKVINHHAYIGSEATGHGMQVFDLHRLRDLQTSDELQIILEDVHYPHVGQSHNIVANPDSNYIYIVGSHRHIPPGVTLCDGGYSCHAVFCAGDTGGLHAVDVSDPDDPMFAGCFGEDGYVHDAECVMYHGPDLRFNGNEICFGYNENSLTIIDVSDKTNMSEISKVNYERTGYTHQGWLTEDHTVLFLDDEADERRADNDLDRRTRTMIFDVTDLKNPTLRTYYFSPEMSVDHNQYVLGDYVYQSNYEAGLRVLKYEASSFSLSEFAFFDVYPFESKIEFSGTWSNYPYLPSGNVLVSSIEYGMFIVGIDMDGQPPMQERHREVQGENCPVDRETRQCLDMC